MLEQRGKFPNKLCAALVREFQIQDNLVSSTVVDMNNIGNCKEFLRLTFEFRLFLRADKKVMLEMSDLETFLWWPIHVINSVDNTKFSLGLHP